MTIIVTAFLLEGFGLASEITEVVPFWDELAFQERYIHLIAIFFPSVIPRVITILEWILGVSRDDKYHLLTNEPNPDPLSYPRTLHVHQVVSAGSNQIG